MQRYKFKYAIIFSLTFAVVSCTFGEGPDLLLSDADDTEATTINTLPDNPQVGNPNPLIESTALVRIPRIDIANAPTIDGDTLDYIEGTQRLGGEWQFAVQADELGNALSINQFMFGRSEFGNNAGGHHWAAVHDGEYLYLLVVSDDAGEHYQDTDELRKPWKDDSVEIYIDGNNSQLDQYDGVDDFHFTTNLQSSVGVANGSNVNNPKLLQSEASATLPSDLSFATGPRNGPLSANFDRGRKDIYEFRIKISELNIQLNSPFGIEVQINDDDNGGTRDWKWGWSHPEGTEPENDYTWQNPSYMAEAILL